MKYKKHTITKTKWSTGVRREAFGHPYENTESIYIIDGPIVQAGITAKLTRITDCKEVITGAIERKER